MKNVYSSKIQYFLRCAEERSFFSAAKSIGISQPALSSAMKTLEEDLGVALFSRSVRGIELTPAGKKIYEHLSRIQGDIHGKILESANEANPLLRMGCVGHIASAYLLDILEKNKKTLPIVHLFTSNSLDCYNEVLSGRLDFAFVTWSKKPQRLKYIRVASEDVAYVGLKAAFPNLEKTKSLVDLSQYPKVDLPKPQRDWTQLLEEDQVGYIAKDVRILRDIVLRGLAVGYLQLSLFTKEERKKLIRAPLKGLYTDPAVYAVYRADISSESKKTMELFCAEVGARAKSSST
ncbi:MAG: LysR family transcriptional regulator [Bdellovibrionota bacterium]